MSDRMKVRLATKGDIPSACHLLNTIIKIGGTTAYEDPLTEAEFASHFLNGPACISLYVCESDAGDILGFQSLSTDERLESGWADIATFASSVPKIKGVGRNLFEATQAHALKMKIRTINATIRADNVAGLSYYSKIGFVDYHVHPAVPLKDGTLVDRLSKKYQVDLAANNLE